MARDISPGGDPRLVLVCATCYPQIEQNLPLALALAPALSSLHVRPLYLRTQQECDEYVEEQICPLLPYGNPIVLPANARMIALTIANYLSALGREILRNRNTVTGFRIFVEDPEDCATLPWILRQGPNVPAPIQVWH